MIEYVAKDGLSILNYLGIFNLTKQEREVFKGRWEEFYKMNDKDSIFTTWTLYSETLPFTCGDIDRGSFNLQTERDVYFDDKLEETRLDEKLKMGLSLEQIFANEPERFFRLN